MTDKEKIREKIEKDFVYYDRASIGNNSPDLVAKRNLCHDWLKYIDSLPKKPVSEELEEAAREYAKINKFMYDVNQSEHDIIVDLECDCNNSKIDAFIAGANWKQEHLWKDAQGDDLPEYDREVVVFTQNFPDDAGIMRVSIAHRPNPDGWDGKSITTGRVEHYTPKTYDKGGWNQPDVIYWLDAPLPKGIE